MVGTGETSQNEDIRHDIEEAEKGVASTMSTSEIAQNEDTSHDIEVKKGVASTMSTSEIAENEDTPHDIEVKKGVASTMSTSEITENEDTPHDIEVKKGVASTMSTSEIAQNEDTSHDIEVKKGVASTMSTSEIAENEDTPHDIEVKKGVASTMSTSEIAQNEDTSHDIEVKKGVASTMSTSEITENEDTPHDIEVKKGVATTMSTSEIAENEDTPHDIEVKKGVASTMSTSEITENEDTPHDIEVKKKEKDIEAGGVDDLNNWLGVTSSRNAKWYSSAFYNTTAMVGAGFLSLPYAMSELGWGPGVTVIVLSWVVTCVTVIVLSWVVTFYTLWQLVEMHEIVPGKRFDRYQELGQHAFGEKLGLYIVVPQQVVVQCGTNIVYMVTAGKCFKKFIETAWPHAHKINTTYYIMMFGAVQLVLSHLPSLNSILWISIVAAVMSICFSAMAWIASIHKGLLSEVNYNPRASTKTGGVFQFFSALGDVAFSYAGHSVVLEIQASIPSKPGKPSKKAMWKGCVVAYIIVAICYFPVSMIGYWVFGNKVEDNILMSVEKPAWLVALANLLVVIHVVGSYQVFAQLVFDMIESFLVMKMKLNPSVILRTVSRSVYVAITMFLGMTFPFFGSLLGFFGGFAFAPTTFFLPCICWLIICKPKPFSLSWTINWICIILGVSLMILAPIGALRQIVLAAKAYAFYS